jgi:predicted dehydrogenase
MKQEKDKKISRRDFLGTAAATTAAFTFVPKHVLGQNGQPSANEKLNIAAIGVGGMGGSNLKAMSDENIVALCDVDDVYAANTFNTYPNAKKYKDYRVMLEKENKNIDAVLIATPDHTHAVIAMMAIQMGKHVYVQKPLTYDVYEARKLTEAAREHKVMTQMGNQGHSGDGPRLMCEWIWSGAIGPVREVHAWTNRPVWPQGIELDRPQDTPPVPETLDWDLWLGPAAYRPYHPAYLPAIWRQWCEFGTGSLGDLGCHVMDPIFWALKLKYPTVVEACHSTYWEGFWKETKWKGEVFPRSTIVRYQFPARQGMPEVKLNWYDGGMIPPRPDDLEDGRQMGDDEGGVIFVGDKGKIMCGCYGRGPRLIPETKMQEFKRPEPSIPRIPDGMGGHEKDWVRSCKDGKPASSNFEYSGPLTEMVVMGNLAVRNPNQRLHWDGENMRFTNSDEANKCVHRVYREGWSL